MSETNISGVFILQEVRERILADVWPATFVLPITGFGWFGGGNSFGVVSTVNRIDFAVDTNIASVRGPLSSGRGYLTATGNDNYGWFGGGYSSTPRSTVDRVTFASDTGTASVRGPLSLARYSLAATGNDNYGWFGGGYSPSRSTVNRIDFAADTGTASVRGSLSEARAQLSATGNNEYGWFGGGNITSVVGPTRSRVDRITFASDTSTTSVRGPLSSNKIRSAATSDDEYGWFGGGIESTFSSKTDRINFADDTSTALVRGPLSTDRSDLAATSGII